jgi:hypothetical protein
MIPALLSLASVASAVDLYLCADVDVDYDDYAVGDRWTNGYDEDAQGFQAYVKNLTTNTQVWPATGGTWGVLDGNGCSPAVSATPGQVYFLMVRSRATVGTHTLNTYDDLATPDLAAAIPVVYTMGNYAVSVQGTLPGSTEHRWNHLALMRYAIDLHDGLMSGETIDLFESGTGNCAFGGNGVVVSDKCRKSKFVIAHELGHLVAARTDVLDHTAISGGDDTNVAEGCAGGAPLRKHYARFAFLEGFGDYYAAITWNSVNQSNCDWARDNALNFNLDEFDDFEPGDTVPCYGDPINGITPNPGTHDWLDQMIDAGAGSCEGQQRNRLTRFDLLRYLWALHVDQGLGVADVWQVWDVFDIKSTDPDDNGDPGDVGGNTAGSNGTTDDPIVRWKEAMESEGFLTEHEAERDHGLDHDPDAL